MFLQENIVHTGHVLSELSVVFVIFIGEFNHNFFTSGKYALLSEGMFAIFDYELPRCLCGVQHPITLTCVGRWKAIEKMTK